VAATTVGDVKRKLGALSDELGKWGVDRFGNVKKEIKKLKMSLIGFGTYQCLWALAFWKLM